MTALFLFALFLKAMSSDFTKWYDKNKAPIIFAFVVAMVFDSICLYNYFKIIFTQ